MPHPISRTVTNVAALFLAESFQIGFVRMKDLKEENLIEEDVQPGTIRVVRQRRWRKLVPVLVLFLLFTDQTWACVLWRCQPEGLVPPSSCHPPHSPEQSKQTMPGVAAPQSTQQCSETQSLVADAHSEKCAHSAMICWRMQRNTEAQAISVTSQNAGLIVAILTFNHSGSQLNSEPLPDHFHRSHQQRPLYLAYSCLLI